MLRCVLKVSGPECGANGNSYALGVVLNLIVCIAETVKVSRVVKLNCVQSC